MRLLLRTAIAASLYVASASAAQIALPTPLSTLVGTSDFVVVGDLTFDAFSYSFTADMPPAESINVIATVDGDGHSGLRFQGGFVDSDAPGASDALIGFRVQTNGPLISDAHLQGNPDLLGGAGLASVTETFLPLVVDDSISIFDNGTVEQLQDWIFFNPPVAALSVQKDISLLAQAGSAGAAISFVDQTFSLIPEPGSFAGMMLGFLALSSLRRRKR